MINELEKIDKSFSEGTFLTKVDHIFIMILNAIMDNDMSSVKHYLSDDVYNKFNEMVNKYINMNASRLFDEMNVSSTNIENIEINDDEILITVNITSKYMDYLIDENGNFLSGVNDHRITSNHKILFSKKRNATSLSEIRRCKNCGSSININNSAICEYCNQPFDMSDYDYIVKNIDIF